MSCPHYDFHIHTKYLGCADSTMEVPAILAECRRIGAAAIGFADHVNLPEQIEKHAQIRCDILAAEPPGLDVYFGVEVNFLGCDGEFPLTAEQKQAAGFQFVIGGIHGTYLDEYDPKKLVEIQHRHHLATCQNPLIDVLVHPYWLSRSEFKRKDFPMPDFDDVPAAYARELGQAAAATGTAVEINADATKTGIMTAGALEAYVDDLAIVVEGGCAFSLSSDAHSIAHLQEVTWSWDVADRLHLPADRIYRPSCAPLK